VYGVLPTWMSASTHSVGYMVFSLIGFVTLYSIFIGIEMYLMIRAIRIGPTEHGGDGGASALPRPTLAPRPVPAAPYGGKLEG
jgi:cytochrome d ubiquinol oxidase subunit I